MSRMVGGGEALLAEINIVAAIVATIIVAVVLGTGVSTKPSKAV
jgi:hypothetical protein